LRNLAFIDNDNFRNTLIHELHQFNELQNPKSFAYNIQALGLRAQKINTLMKKDNLTYTEALAWETPAIQGLFSQEKELHDQHLIKYLLLIVATYLAPLTDKESRDLFKKSTALLANKFPKPPTSTKASGAAAARARHDLFTQRNNLSNAEPSNVTPEPPALGKRAGILPPIQTGGNLFQKYSSKKKSSMIKTAALPDMKKVIKQRWK
jgi:hypothetical protein